MCDPLTIGIGLAVATTAVSVVGQIQQANQANAAIKAQLKVEDKQIDQKATQEIDNRLREARRDMGRIMVAAGESGLSLESGSVKALEEDAAMQASLDNEQSLANRESRKEAARADANSKMVSKPTVLGAGLQIAAAGLSAAQSGGAFKKPGG
jgi:cell division protein FtsL